MSALDGSVNLPGVGDVSKKTVAIAGGCVAAIVGVGWYRKRQAAMAVTAVVPDPTASGGGFSDTVAGSDSYDQYGGGSTTTGGDPVPAPINLQNPGILTNQDWKAAATTVNLGGVDADLIASVASKVLGGVALTQAEAEIAQEIFGEIGYPPQGYPPLKLTTATPGGGTTVPIPPKTPAGPHNRYTARNQSMYEVEKIAHPHGTPAQWNELALEAIHTNNDAGIHRWPSGVPGAELTQRKISGQVIVV